MTAEPRRNVAALAVARRAAPSEVSTSPQANAPVSRTALPDHGTAGGPTELVEPLPDLGRDGDAHTRRVVRPEPTSGREPYVRTIGRLSPVVGGARSMVTVGGDGTGAPRWTEHPHGSATRDRHRPGDGCLPNGCPGCL